jgi:hypothetical protein
MVSLLRWLVPLLAAVAALGAAAMAADQKSITPTPIAVLPEGEGRDLVWVHCNICHDLWLVRQQRLDRGAWKGVLNDMKNFGAFFSEEQRGVILDYLVKNYGPRS